MAGRKSRDKGLRAERAVVRLLQDNYGIPAERIPLSGSAGGSFAGDVSIPILGRDRKLEVKCRAGGFSQIYDWLGDNFGLVLKADHKPMLVVMRLADAAEVLRLAEQYRSAAEVMWRERDREHHGEPAGDLLSAVEIMRRAG